VPEGEFDLILCRNAALTYFEPALQHEVMRRVIAPMRPGGALVIGIHESLPGDLAGLAPWEGARAIYRKLAPAVAEHGP
jgi:chemotaxis protein methyltransferase CheR